MRNFTYSEKKELLRTIGRFEVMDDDHYGLLKIISLSEHEFAIGLDDDCDKAVREYMEDAVWSFNHNFLAEVTGLPEEVFIALQPQCEGSNLAIKELIKRTCGMETFTETAISWDGRGHFLASYDSCETETGKDLYLYQIA
jgi:hypothetical protein